MTFELGLMMGSLVLFSLYLGAQSTLYRWRHGLMFAQTARDETVESDGVFLGRAERALRNFLETWPALIILALVGHLVVPGDPLVFWGGIIWFVCRLAYLPLYLFGVFMVRSLVWFTGAIGLALMFFGVLF
ncbi:MAG: MAPEG family protein [Devosia sp.]